MPGGWIEWDAERVEVAGKLWRWVMGIDDGKAAYGVRGASPSYPGSQVWPFWVRRGPEPTSAYHRGERE
jgi:hypothetical protein